MTNPPPPFARSRAGLGLLTDLYELTMAYGYRKSGLSAQHAAFHLSFRTAPFSGAYAIAAGLGDTIEFLSRFGFADDDLAYLGGLSGNDGRPLFDADFLDYLAAMRFTCDVDAVPEGTLVFPHEPLLRVCGPIDQAQIVETALLNTLNFQTLIATKASRICLAAQGDPVIEFGLRRAQGIDGGLAATRAAIVGGCESTSNVLAGKLFDVPVRGTQAHSWITAFPDEESAFEAYADAMPNNCILLVDTYDTLKGVRHAVKVGRRLRQRGHDLAGIRLDSGDLAYLSVAARMILDESGFQHTAILASNNLDEEVIASLKAQGAAISSWGVGTRLVTGHEQSALGGVYKLGAIRRAADAPWDYRLKLSEDPAKISIPGVLNVRRFTQDGYFVGDMIVNEAAASDPAGSRVLVDPANPLKQKTIAPEATAETLLVPIFRAGKPTYTPPPLTTSRDRTAAQLKSLHPGHTRLLNPHAYPAGLEESLNALRSTLINSAKPGR